MEQESKVKVNEVNKKKLVSIGVVPLLALALLLQAGAGAASFLVAIVLVFQIEAAWNRYEKKGVPL